MKSILILALILSSVFESVAQRHKKEVTLEDELKSFFDIKFDKFSPEQITWYQPWNRSTNLSGEVTYLFFGAKNGYAEMIGMVIKRRSTDGFIGIDEYRFNIDGEAFILETEYGDVMRKIGDDTYHEWGEVYLTAENQLLYEALKTAKVVEMQFRGIDGAATRKVSDREIEAMQKTIYYFEKMGGSL